MENKNSKTKNNVKKEKITEAREKRNGWLLQNWQKLVILLIFWALISVIISFDVFTKNVTGLEIGKPSPRTIKASRAVEFVDVDKTKELKEKASESVSGVYEYDATLLVAIENEIENFFSKVSEAIDNEAMDFEGKVTFLKSQFGEVISETTIKTCLSLPKTELSELSEKTQNIALEIQERTISANDLEISKSELKVKAQEGSLKPEQKEVIAEIGSVFLKPNYFYNREETEKLRKEAAEEIPEQVISKMEGEIVIREGEIVTDEVGRILSELGMLRRSIDLKRILGISLLVFTVLFVFSLFVFQYYSDVYGRKKLLILLGLILFGTVLLAKLITPFYSFYIVPVTAGGMMVASLLSPGLAVIVLFCSVILTSLIVGSDLSFIITALVSGLFSIYIFTYFYQKGKMIRGGVLVSLVIALIILMTNLIFELSFLGALVNGGMGLAGGFFTVVLTIGFIPFLESAFSITTNYRILELGNPNHPLLKELMFSAPGTYNHSVLVGNLAESAAQAIGANSILARVGSYYHDIGKIKRPSFFIENQMGGENPHDKTNPSLSCLIITSHIKDGLEMAEAHHLPEELISIINEHHGTSLVSYFYHKAKEDNDKEDTSKEDFRYSGEKPHTKESAIIMLADSVEAAARTLPEPTVLKLKQLVKKIIRDKLNDGQLDESDLTLAEINKITGAFIKALISSYHGRIEYPEGDLNQEITQIGLGSSAE
ncbi:MAG: HDIG domain-containing protein [Actinomycetia bacterium]|nr:HDIG domain-containing protein [Actinomycetes bacterium]